MKKRDRLFLLALGMFFAGGAMIALAILLG